MNKKFSLKKIYFTASIISVAIITGASLTLKILTSDSRIYTLFLLASFTLVICVIFTLAFTYHIITLFSNNLYEIIDAMINGADLPQKTNHNETLLSQVTHHLLRLYMILNTTKNKVTEEKKELQELITDISHQIKTPVTTLRLSVSAMKNAINNPEEMKSFLHSIDVHLNKLDFLLSSLITSSRLETGIINLIPHKHNISDTIVTSLENVIIAASQKKIDITFEYSKDIYAIHDPKWTAEALFNILDNAVKYTPINGSIFIELSVLDIYTQISIKDTGIGISENELSNIFKRFYRAGQVLEFPGVGIGLYLAREIINRQSGFIYVTSHINLGSTFQIYLPNA